MAEELTRSPVHTTLKRFPYSPFLYEMEGLTLQKIFRGNAKKFWNRPHMGVRPFDKDKNQYQDYEYLKFSETNELVTFLGSGLRAIGLNPQDKFGIMAKNCREWGLTDYATACQSMVLVPIYDSYGKGDCEYIICHSEMRAIICSPVQLEFLVSIKNSGKSKFLEFLIVIDDGTDQPLPEGVTHSFSQLIELGKKNPLEDVVAQPDDPFTIVYTSGTTGSPKGVILTQNNVAAGAMQLGTLVAPNFDDDDDQECCPSYLPLAHIFGRIAEYTIASWGGKMAYFTGSMPNLVDDIRCARPTILPGVPRIFMKTYNKVKANIDSQPFYKRWVFSLAYRAKLNAMVAGKPIPAWTDKLVFDKVRAIMGGRVRVIFNGSAPLPFAPRQFLSVCFGTIFGEGYGMTETSATLTCCQKTKFDDGNVGVPYHRCEVCLESIPEMECFVEDKPYPRGEILIRGPNVFKGYYKEEEATRASLDEQGWFHTGDVGSWVPGPYPDDEGRHTQPSLRIIDRKRNIFKLAQGEFVVAERIEAAILAGTPYVKQLLVYGPSTASGLVAILVPEWDLLLSKERKDETGSETWENGIVVPYWSSERPTTPAQAGGEILAPLALRSQLAESAAVRAFVMGAIRKVCEAPENKDKIRKFEIPRGVVLCAEEWTDTNRLMTPSAKVKRELVREKYRAQIQAELALIDPPGSGNGSGSGSSSSSGGGSN